MQLRFLSRMARRKWLLVSPKIPHTTGSLSKPNIFLKCLSFFCSPASLFLAFSFLFYFWWAATFIRILALSFPVLLGPVMWSGGADRYIVAPASYGYIYSVLSFQLQSSTLSQFSPLELSFLLQHFGISDSEGASPPLLCHLLQGHSARIPPPFTTTYLTIPLPMHLFPSFPLTNLYPPILLCPVSSFLHQRFFFHILANSGFSNGTQTVFVTKVLNFFTYFSLFSVSSNTNSTFLHLSRFLSTLLCDQIAFTPSLALFHLITFMLVTMQLFPSNRTIFFWTFDFLSLIAWSLLWLQ